MAIGEICSRVVVFTRRSDSVRQAARLMREHHVGALVGIVTADDFLDLLAEELGALARMVSREQRREASARNV